jgi:nucleoside-diphosphate kinase
LQIDLISSAILQFLVHLQGYEISAMQSVIFNQTQAEEFLEVYKDVVPDFAERVSQLCAGVSIGLEIRASDAVSVFRQTAGPWDVSMAKHLRPSTIRGQFGVDNIRCAVHCTDLPEDGVPECQYIFEIMSS